MISKVNGSTFSKIYDQSLPAALSFMLLKLNEVIEQSNNDINEIMKLEGSLQKVLTKQYLKFQLPQVNRLSKDEWI